MSEPYNNTTIPTTTQPHFSMGLSKRSTPSPIASQTGSSTRDLKQRVITNINKLSDRDTYAIAITELESIARNLSHDSFSLYLSCIYYTDPTQKSLVRKQCARLLGFLSEIHGDALSPFVSKMISNVIRRLRDSDSTVRSTLIESVSIMASQISKPPFSVFLKPLVEAISVEQDLNSQIGSSLCLASAIDASPDPDVAQLQRLVPKLMKLLKSDSFKAKPALLSLITSIVGTGAVSNQNLLGSLVPVLVEFLSSEDWAARKAAAEALERLAIVDRDLVSEFKSSCLSIFESRRFDKVKAVRETMSQMLEAWKDVPDVSDEVSRPSQSKSSLKGNVSDACFQHGSKNSVTPQSRKFKSPTSRLAPNDRSSATNIRERSPRKISESKSTPALFRKLDRKKPTNWKVDISGPHTLPTSQTRDLRDLECGEDGDDRCHKLETRRALFNRNGDDKVHKYAGKSGSRVVPIQMEECLESTVVASNNTEDLNGNHQNGEDLSLIKRQLIQIENQQSSLLDLLQRFMGSSQNGMQSLETRVHGLEVTLDEICYDLAVSTGRISNPESSGYTCCKIPGTEFLSSKFWRKTDGRYSTSRFSSSIRTPLRVSMRNMADRDGNTESFQMESRMFRLQGGGELVVNPLADISGGPAESSQSRLNRLPVTSGQNSERGQGSNRTADLVLPSVGA
ncbi:microtubule-associated protein TORTIFOLIA1-like [Thalictrum thalictroides]|uniref:Microtubule-associated protein TORTIFOLIA1-like n=1 Tax=Thalictrum thalictroides TaxID=46969 RepID=A0A7J6WL15_THATH|nr:microtubule-associated protein TORTIFOLIA1-like [Thalictrum thalictroides]